VLGIPRNRGVVWGLAGMSLEPVSKLMAALGMRGLVQEAEDPRCPTVSGLCA
jgi:hypothetical protein